MTRKPSTRPAARANALLARLQAFDGYVERAVSIARWSDADVDALVAGGKAESAGDGRYVRARVGTTA
ncbi:MAG: hypothetical protein AB7P02_05280 [Alphaproteobacteria bacterium]